MSLLRSRRGRSHLPCHIIYSAFAESSMIQKLLYARRNKAWSFFKYHLRLFRFADDIYYYQWALISRERLTLRVRMVRLGVASDSSGSSFHLYRSWKIPQIARTILSPSRCQVPVDSFERQPWSSAVHFKHSLRWEDLLPPQRLVLNAVSFEWNSCHPNQLKMLYMRQMTGVQSLLGPIIRTKYIPHPDVLTIGD